MLDADCRSRPIGLAALIALVVLAPIVPTASAVRGHAKRCKSRQVRVVVGKHASCVAAQTFTRGVPRGGDALAMALGRLSRRRGGAGAITTALGPKANAVARWEDRLVGAGRAALRAKGALLASDGRLSSAANDQAIQLHVGNPPGSAPTAEARVRTDSGTDGVVLNETTSTTGGLTVTLGPITTVVGRYSFSEDTRQYGVFCPTEAGVVRDTGGFSGTRTLVRGRHTTTEAFKVLFVITGRIDRHAKLTGYDVHVSAASTDAAGHSIRVSGSANGLSPSSSRASIAPAQVTLQRSRGLADDRAFVTEAMNYARDQGLIYLQNAETVFNKEASCLRVEGSPAEVKRGSEAAIAIRVFSRITGKQVDADLTLRPSGGAQAKPESTRTTSKHPAIVDIRMPAAPRSRARDAHQAAATPSVAITGLSEQGRAVGTINSPAGPVALVFDSTIVNAAPAADSHESGSITYHVHAVVPLTSQDPSAGNEPLGPASAPLTWVSVAGQHNKAGLIACSPVDQPYSLVETAAAPNNGTLRLTRSSSAGGDGPAGLTLRLQPSPVPTDQLHSVFQGTCPGFWAPFDRISTGSSWYHEFLDNHLAAVAAGDPCNTTTNGPSCSFDITGWKPGTAGIYATWQYRRAGFIGCPLPGYTCFGSSTQETTTIELRETS